MDSEMLKALAEDAEKPEHLTGENHEPLMLVECPHCCGEGSRIRSIEVYERGCAFSHADEFAVRCDHCGGTGLLGFTIAETLEMYERDDD